MQLVSRARILFGLFAVLVLFTFATPAQAQAIQYRDNCYKCRWIYNPWDYSTTYYCGQPDSGSYGNLQCTINWFGVCWTEGDLCYYIEVTPR